MITEAQRPSPFTLHIRLTHACNASCTYCSSWKRDPNEKMTLSELSDCIDGLELFWRKTGISPNYLNIEYVGGEIMLIDPDSLSEMVNMVRDRLGSRATIRDGAQSNLIGSSRRVSQLYELFDGRVGTSVDNFSNQRQLGNKGSQESKARKYKTFFIEKSNEAEAISGEAPPAVITLDKFNVDKVVDEIKIGVSQRRNLTLRPVFQGGRDIDGINDAELGQAMVDGFKEWVKLGMSIRVEPFVTLFRKRLGLNLDDSFCAWQRDCAIRSLSIEPNGDFYVCQELADTETFKLGNLILKDFDFELHSRLAKRVDMLDKGCFECPYFSSCQGGCMQQSTEVGTGMYGKTQWCKSWKMLFSEMDEYILSFGRDRLKARFNTLFEGF